MVITQSSKNNLLFVMLVQILAFITTIMDQLLFFTGHKIRVQTLVLMVDRKMPSTFVK